MTTTPSHPPTTSNPIPSSSSWFQSRWSVFICLSLIFCLSLYLRINHYQAIGPTAYPYLCESATGTDMHFYWEWSQRIADGDWWQKDTYHPGDRDPTQKENLPLLLQRLGGPQIFHWEPIYPYFLAVLRLFDTIPPTILLIQLLLGSLQPLVTYLLARYFLSKPASLLAALLSAIYGPLLFNQGTMQRDWIQPLTEPFILISLLWAASHITASSFNPLRHYRWFIAGLVLGACLLSKSTALMYIPVAIFFILHHARYRIPLFSLRLSLWLLGAFIAFSPLMTRNIIAGAPPFAINNRVALSLICGNAADASPIGYTEPPSTNAILDQAQGSTLKTLWLTLKTNQGNWSGFFAKQWEKLCGWIYHVEIPDNLSFYYALDISPILQFLPRYSLLWPLAGLGVLLVGLPNYRKHWPLLATGAAICCGLMLTMVIGRFRLPLVPLMAIYASAFLFWFTRILFTRQFKWLLPTIPLAILLVAFQHWPLRNGETQEELSEVPFVAIHPLEYFCNAQFYAFHQRIDEAVAELARVRTKAERNPSHPVYAEIKFATWYYETQHRLFHFYYLLENHRLQEAKNQLDLAYIAALKSNHPDPYWVFANLYLRTQQPDTARSLLQSLVTTQPNHPNFSAAKQLLSQLTP